MSFSTFVFIVSVALSLGEATTKYVVVPILCLVVVVFCLSIMQPPYFVFIKGYAKPLVLYKQQNKTNKSDGWAAPHGNFTPPWFSRSCPHCLRRF